MRTWVRSTIQDDRDLATQSSSHTSTGGDPTIGGPARAATPVGPFLTERKNCNESPSDKMSQDGILSKRLTAPSRSGPSREWLKSKNPNSPAMIRARERFALLGE
jgi:hypothetical protein